MRKIDIFRQNLITPVTVTNTMALTSLFAVTLPPGELLFGREINLKLGGVFSSDAAAQSMQLQVLVGGDLVLANAGEPVVASASGLPWELDVGLTLIGGFSQLATSGAWFSKGSGVPPAWHFLGGGTIGGLLLFYPTVEVKFHWTTAALATNSLTCNRASCELS